MRLIDSALLTLSIIILFASCQREVEDTIPERPTGNSDSILLAGFAELDTTLPSGMDTLWYVRYSYDAAKRVKNATYAYGLGGQFDTEYVDYFYSGNDTLPNKIVVTWMDVSNTYRDTVFYTYVNGQVSVDSTVEWRINTNDFWGTTTETYTPSGNNIIVQYRLYNSPGVTPPDHISTPQTITRTFANGNITTQDNPPNFHFGERDHVVQSYDNKVNPFYKAEIPYPLLYAMRMQKNNTIEEKLWDDPTQIWIHYQYSYTYREDGYPLVVRIKDMLSPPDGTKGVYWYTK
jgi:hypothetical protein